PGLAIKTLRTLPLSLILIGALLSFGCEDTAEDIDRLANITPEEAVDISKNVTVIYSDSARVKAQLTAPEMRVYHDSTGAMSSRKAYSSFFTMRTPRRWNGSPRNTLFSALMKEMLKLETMW